MIVIQPKTFQFPRRISFSIVFIFDKSNPYMTLCIKDTQYYWRITVHASGPAMQTTRGSGANCTCTQEEIATEY